MREVVRHARRPAVKQLGGITKWRVQGEGFNMSSLGEARGKVHKVAWSTEG